MHKCMPSLPVFTFHRWTWMWVHFVSGCVFFLDGMFCGESFTTSVAQASKLWVKRWDLNSESFFSSPDVKQASDRIQSWSQHNVKRPDLTVRTLCRVHHPDGQRQWAIQMMSLDGMGKDHREIPNQPQGRSCMGSPHLLRVGKYLSRMIVHCTQIRIEEQNNTSSDAFVILEKTYWWLEESP